MSEALEGFSRLRLDGSSLGLINASGLSDQVISTDDGLDRVAKQMSAWVDSIRGRSHRPSLFERGAFSVTDNPYDHMRAAKAAMSDDIVSNVADITESFAFQGVKWESSDPDESDVHNQINRDLDMDSVLRKMWRDVYTFSTYYAASTWGWREYRVRGKTETGNPKRKTYRLWCPTEIRLLDPRKIIPLNSGPFGIDLLGWMATQEEMDRFSAVRSGEVLDPMMDQFYAGVWNPTITEEYELARLGVDPRRILVLNPDSTWRFTLTKPDYERFAEVRMRSIFDKLDLKEQLTASDRAMLVGAANYILLIRKGTDEQPAQQPEVDNLRQNYNFIARMPVIISDHRLAVDIIAPKVDFVLQGDRYDVLDTRILARLLGTLTFSSRGQRNETNQTLSTSLGKGLQSRRHMMKRVLEGLMRQMREHPRNAGSGLREEQRLGFLPRQISLETDAALIQTIWSMRQAREISRETLLEQFGMDQSIEAVRREVEAVHFDDVFKTIVPHGSPQLDRGGRPAGGGGDSGTGEPKPLTENGNPSTKAATECGAATSSGASCSRPGTRGDGLCWQHTEEDE